MVSEPDSNGICLQGDTTGSKFPFSSSFCIVYTVYSGFGSGAGAATMNASANSQEDKGIGGSDSDSNPDDTTDYYQPISSVGNDGGEDSDDGGGGGGDFSGQDPNSTFHQLPNGWTENGVSSLDTSDDDADEDAEKEIEEATESERAIERAFREDEARRNAPLTAENTGRVMDAMRRISFGGGAPDWAGEIPEDQWIDRLRRLRPPSSAASAGAAPIDH